MKENRVNYIIHLNTVMKYFELDDRVLLSHIGFYLILFHKWNQCGFKNPISVHREDMMQHGRIGSRNTYIKLLKTMTLYGYIVYLPSKNPNMASSVYMFNFCTSPVHVLGSYINYIKLLNLNYNKGKVWIEKRNKVNKDGDSIKTTCSFFEQVLNKSYTSLIKSESLGSTKTFTKHKEKRRLYPTGIQPDPNADYSEPL